MNSGLSIGLLACSVFEQEIAMLTRGATHIVETRWFEMGLHDNPNQLRARLQAELHSIEMRDDIEAVVLAYGLCGRGTAGLHPLRHKLVIPRAHDCITVFLGSKEAYAEHQRRCPTCYYYTPGWNRGRRVPGPEKLEALKTELTKKFDADDVEFLVETEREQWASHDTATYLDLGTDDAEPGADYARRCAEWLGWKFERIRGDATLLRDLLWGNWDAARFQIIEPGMQLAQSADDDVMRAQSSVWSSKSLTTNLDMKLKLVRHLWGVDHTHGLDHYLPRWREVGYDTIEASLQFSPDCTRLVQFLKSTGWNWIPQVFSLNRESTTCGPVGEHLDSLRAQIEECLEHRPLFINAHSGSDAWSFAEAEDFYGAALQLERSLGVTIAHETHRQRYFGNPWATRDILRKFPDLKLTCDFSHWVCVAERLLPDCDDIIRLAAQRCHHIHARVGHQEGPQVPDPRAPEWARHVAAHEAWWDLIWAAQQQRGLTVSTLTPEFGPPPYLHTLPHTQTPVADLADICDWQARRQTARFAAHCG